MAGFRKPEVPRNQLTLWSAKLDDALPADHPVRHVAYLLEGEPFATTFGEWTQDYVLLEGQPPYHPRDLTGLYLYGMLNRIRSSRQLESACWNRLDVIWLMSGQHPDHSTIAEFVDRHGRRLRRLFREVVQVGIRAGLVKLEHVSIDGTKIEADAGKQSVHSEKTLAELLGRVDERIAVLEQEWSENEARESRLFGEQVPWTPGREGTAAQRLARLKREQERLKEALSAIKRRRQEQVRGSAPKAIASVTDPASRVMPDKEGKSKPNYNAQVAVEVTAGMVVAHAVNDRAEDSGQMTPMLKQVGENCGALPEEASADSQYHTGPELASLEQMGVKGFLPAHGERSAASPAEGPAAQALAAAQGGAVLTDEQWEALPKDGEGRIDKAAFRYQAEADVYRCPMGQELRYLRSSRDAKQWGVAVRSQYGGCPACARCPRARQCCRDPAKGRTINRDQYEAYRERMAARMNSAEGRSRYRLRGQTVEPRIGLIKGGLGIRRFLRRGLERVGTEWSLICTTLNMGILLRHWPAVEKTLG
jgi:transposase